MLLAATGIMAGETVFAQSNNFSVSQTGNSSATVIQNGQRTTVTNGRVRTGPIPRERPYYAGRDGDCDLNADIVPDYCDDDDYAEKPAAGGYAARRRTTTAGDLVDQMRDDALDRMSRNSGLDVRSILGD
ncbi:MAG: hypothetical protein AAF318_03245 [Pseudomonadota bacterium]